MTVRIRLKRQKRRSSFLKSGCSCGGFEAVLRKRTKKKSPENRLVTGLFGGELGIRTLEAFRLTAFRVLHLRPLGQLSVYVIPFSFEKLFARTDGKNSKLFSFSNRVKPAWLQGFWWTKRTASRKISSQSRYDRFDTFPYSAKAWENTLCAYYFIGFERKSQVFFGKKVDIYRAMRLQ